MVLSPRRTICTTFLRHRKSEWPVATPLGSDTWRWTVDAEQLRRVDFLMYQLGVFSPPSCSEAGPDAHSPAQRKKRHLPKGDALTKLSVEKALLHRGARLGVTPSSSCLNGTSEAASARPQMSLDDAADARPFSTLKDMEAMERAALSAYKSWKGGSSVVGSSAGGVPGRKRPSLASAPATDGQEFFSVTFDDLEATIREYRGGTVADDPSKMVLCPSVVGESLVSRPQHGVQVLGEGRSPSGCGGQEWEASMIPVEKHPSHLFSDEAAVRANFGMGCFVAGQVAGFSGLFRQQWQDFHVTEMEMTPEGGSPLSRSLSYKLPSVPEFIRQQVGAVDSVKSPAVAVAEADGDPARSTSNHGALGGPTSEDLASFFSVDVERHGKALLAEMTATVENGSGSAMRGESGGDRIARHTEVPSHYYLQCSLHKQHIAHGVAMAQLSKTLRIHPRSISVAGIKDYIGDTIQRVRLEDVSPSSALAANALFKKHNWSMRLSNFTYETAPLAPGDLFGNHFKIVLREVSVPREVVQEAMHSFEANGFPNYYGCQRFSWFGGREHDPAFAILNRNWLVFAFRFLNYTEQSRTLRELLQRPKRYPIPVQDQYRRNVVRRLRKLAIEPSELDVYPFLSCPSLSDPLLKPGGTAPRVKQELVLLQLEEAFFDLELQSRRLLAQRLSSYLWNQALSLRLHHFGGASVLLGDHVAPAEFRSVAQCKEDRQGWFHALGSVVDEANMDQFRIEDVVHPGFSFEGAKLPTNAVGGFYRDICAKYRLDWGARHARAGLVDFREPPRPIIRKPIGLKYHHDLDTSTVTLEFALERGCYANVAITELMKLCRCAGSQDILTTPLRETLWDDLGTEDPGYVTSLQDIYEGFEEGQGFVSDIHQIEATETSVFDHKGPLFLPPMDDPARVAYQWGKKNLIRNMRRRESDEQAMQLRLMEKPLADSLRSGEASRYAGHTVPMPPNAKGKRIFFKVLRRQLAYAGAPKFEPRVKLGAQVPNRPAKRAAFRTLNRGTWNVRW